MWGYTYEPRDRVYTQIKPLDMTNDDIMPPRGLLYILHLKVLDYNRRNPRHRGQLQAAGAWCQCRLEPLIYSRCVLESEILF